MNLLRTLSILGACLASLICVNPAMADTSGYGRLTGVVLDLAGTPQMGVTIWLSPEAVSERPTAQLLTNQNGVFDSSRLRPGLYSVRATLAGFLPAVQQHIRIRANLTTLVRIELDSVFASLNQLRREPPQPSETDDWKWVLRTSAASRPILQLLDGTIVVANERSVDADSSQPQDRTRVELTNGSIRPGSPSARAGSLGTAVSYDQALGPAGRLLVAGRMGYDTNASRGGQGALTGGIASIWLPSGEWGRGPETSVILRQVRRLFPGGQTLRVMRIGHAEQLAFSEHLMLSYAGDLVMGGIGRMTSTVRPRAQLAWRISPRWSATISLQTDPQSGALKPGDQPLQSAIDALSTTPVLIWRDGRISSLAGGWHKEISVRRSLSARRSLEAAVFHDFSGHQAVSGVDITPSANISSTVLLRAYAHDAGAGGSYGARAIYKEKVSEDLEVAAIYSWAGALAPDAGALNPAPDFHDALRMRYRQSIAGRVSGKVPKTGTQFAASYKWLDGTIVSRQDIFGEAALGVDPYLSFTIRQPLPSFHTGGHWEAMADFRNLLSQGYVPLATQEGRFLLIPVERSFQGGVSFQF